jgi:protein TonB
MQSAQSSMATSELSNLPMPASPSPAGPPGPGPSGWLSPHSAFEQKAKRKISGAFGVSLAVHAAIAFMLMIGIRQAVISQQPDVPLTMPVFMDTPGPGGGGGGNPAPAPPKKIEIPKPKAMEPIPIPVPVPVEPPPPSLTAPVQTNVAMLQAAGASSFSLSQLGGGGRGSGIGPGTGNGLGPGEGGGTGGGVYNIGNGVNSPELIIKIDPTYTSDAMRAKLQGEVWLNAIVQTNGLLRNITVSKSLDRTFGLDQAAIDAAKKWRFKPGTLKGAPVEVNVQLILEFRLH